MTEPGQPALFVPPDQHHEWGPTLNVEHGPQSSPHTCAVQVCIQPCEVKVDSKLLKVRTAMKRPRLETKP
jgi:hypothetical protein